MDGHHRDACNELGITTGRGGAPRPDRGREAEPRRRPQHRPSAPNQRAEARADRAAAGRHAGAVGPLDRECVGVSDRTVGGSPEGDGGDCGNSPPKTGTDSTGRGSPRTSRRPRESRRRRRQHPPLHPRSRTCRCTPRSCACRRAGRPAFEEVVESDQPSTFEQVATVGTQPGPKPEPESSTTGTAEEPRPPTSATASSRRPKATPMCFRKYPTAPRVLTQSLG